MMIDFRMEYLPVMVVLACAGLVPTARRPKRYRFSLRLGSPGPLRRPALRLKVAAWRAASPARLHGGLGLGDYVGRGVDGLGHDGAHLLGAHGIDGDLQLRDLAITHNSLIHSH
jgi:hypothetical protein